MMRGGAPPMPTSGRGGGGGATPAPACSVLGIFGAKGPNAAARGYDLRVQARQMSALMRHRGPDWAGTYISRDGTHAIAHERLSIVDPESGEQPLYSQDRSVTLAVNGEIYNHLELKAEVLEGKAYFSTGSDCEVVIPLYQKFGATAEMVDHLDGIFAFVLLDERLDTFVAARDPLGVIPLYWGWSPDGAVCFASEMKSIQERCEQFEQFPPGHYFVSGDSAPRRWFRPHWLESPVINRVGEHVNLVRLRETFERAVTKRMMADVPWGVLLSGGLDSSLVASIAKRAVDARGGSGTNATGNVLHSFCIGLKGSPDIDAAQRVADFLGTKHHSFQFTIDEALDSISDAIYHMETYDVTTIRAGTPMFLLARKIKAMGIKMVMSGEGADELFGGYLYFHKAPNAQEFHAENVAKLQDLHLYDCLRANKAMAAWGVEARVPFLDREVLDYNLSFDAADKMCVDEHGQRRPEKSIIRQAFDTPENPYLPHDVLWRQKEQFSDGVGYNWIDSLRDNAEARVSDRQFEQRAHRFPFNTPPTKEAYFVREVFEAHFPSVAAIQTVKGGPSIACSTAAAIEWDETFKAAAHVGGDQSGRSVDVHDDAYDDLVGVASGQRAKAAAQRQQQVAGVASPKL